MSYTAIKLNQIAAPDVVEALDFETILSAMIADLIERAPELEAVLALESDPLAKILEICAYRELIMRQRVNDASRQVMLATADGTNLEQLGALLGVVRLTVTPAQPDAVPPVAAVMESDDVLRLRIQLALEGFAAAGPRGAYEFHARSASPLVADVAVDSPDPGAVRVTIMSAEGDGTPSVGLLNTVQDALSAEDVRPLCDTVAVQGPIITEYQIAATLDIAQGPDGGVVLDRARASVQAYADSVRRIGQPVTVSGLHAALHRDGVVRVTLASPAAEVDPGPIGLANCTQIEVVAG